MHEHGSLDFGMKMTPKQKERRERILKVTTDHLRKHGYDHVNMRDLAEAADVSPTTLYRLFDSKETLVLATVRDQIDRITSSVAEKETAGVGRLFALLRSFAVNVTDDKAVGEAIPTLLFMAEAGAPATEILLANAIRARTLTVKDMKQLDEIDAKTDADHLAKQLTMATWGPMLLWSKGFIEAKRLADEMVIASIWVLLPVLTSQGIAKARAEIKKHPGLSVLKAHLKSP